MRESTVFTIIAALLLGAGMAEAQWQHQPPDYPYLRAFAADSAGTPRLAAPEHGLWRQSTAGSWERISDALDPHYLQIEGFLTPTAALDTVYAIQRNHVFESTDYGVTWREWGNIGNANNLAIWQRNHRVWFRLGYGEFERSEDYGATWSEPVFVTLMAYNGRLYQDPAHDSTLFIAGYYDTSDGGATSRGLVRSDDLGQTWRPLLPLYAQCGVASARVLQVLRLPEGTLLAHVMTSTTGAWPRGALLASLDEGQTWSVRTIFPCELRNLEATAVPGRLFATALRRPDLLRSEDGGATWSAALPGLLPYLYRQPHSGHLWVSSINHGLVRSTDDGVTWTPAALPPIGNPITLAPRQQTLFAEGYGLLSWLAPGTTGWTRCAPLPTFGDSVYLYPKPLTRRGSDLRVLYACNSGTPGAFRKNYLAHSTDNGASWSLDSTLPANAAVITASVVETGAGARYVCVLDSYDARWITRSEDGGQTWTDCAPLPGGEFPGAILQNAEYILAIGYGQMGGLSYYLSADGGASWPPFPWPETPGISFATFANGELYAVGDTVTQHFVGGVWQTPHRKPSSSGLVGIPGEPPLLLTHNYDSRTLYRSRDDGATWDALPYTLPIELDLGWVGFEYDPANQRLWLTTELGPLWASLETILAADEPVPFHPLDYTVLSCYPNPFNSTTRIRYDLLAPGRVELTLYDLQGRLVKTLVDNIVGAGRYEVRVEGPDLASGTYFAKLTTPTLTRTQKILLLK